MSEHDDDRAEDVLPPRPSYPSTSGRPGVSYLPTRALVAALIDAKRTFGRREPEPTPDEPESSGR